MKLLRRFLAPLLAFLVALAPAQPQLSLPIAPATVLAVSAVTAAINFTPLSAGALTPAEKPVILGGIQSWSFPGSSADLYFARNAGSCAINRLLKPCASLLTTTRASTGYAQWADGHLSSFAANIPRITDLGLLVEQAATNIVIQSGFASGWTTQNSTVTTGQSAPDGTTNAIKLTDSVGSAQHRQFQGSITVTNVPWTFSVYAKAGTIPYIQVLFNDGTTSFWANFNISTGVVASKAASATNQTITALANGLYRCSFTATPVAGTGNIQILMLDTDVPSVAPSYTGTGAGTVFLWGPQLEASAFPTSYIPTTTVSVTRAADVITLAGAGLTAALAAKAMLFINNGSQAIQVGSTRAMDFNGSGTMILTNGTTVTISSGGNSAAATLGSGSTTTLAKSAFGFDGTSMTAIANGGAKATTANAWTAASPVYVGNNSAGTKAINGYLQRLAFGTTKGQFDGLTQ